MSIRWMTAVFDALRPHGADRLMLVALADNANDEGVCWPSIPTLAKKCAVEPRTAQRTIRRLEEKGYLVTEDRPGKSTVYHLQRDALTPDAHVTPDVDATPDAGVTPTPDAHATPPLTPTSPKPSYNHHLNPQQQPRARANHRSRDAGPADGEDVVVVFQDEKGVEGAGSDAAAVDLLVRVGVSSFVAAELASKHGWFRVHEVIAHAKNLGDKSAGWIVAALRGGWELQHHVDEREAEPLEPLGPQTAEEAEAWLDELIAEDDDG